MSNEPVQIVGSKILVVDDKQENLELLTSILEEEGYEIAFALDGMKAIEIATMYQPDLILLDVMMPGIDGFETCRRMKSLTELREIPIIFVTAKTDISDIVAAFEIGAVDYVTKPIKHEEIVARVATHIQLRKLLTIRDDLISQLRQKNVELENFSKLKDERLEESEKVSHLGELVGELTHELATPLGIINTAISTAMEKSKVLSNDLDNEKLSKTSLTNYLGVAKESFDISLSNLRYANQLVSSFKEIVVGEFSEARIEFDLKHFLEDIYFLMMPKIKRSPHQLEISCPSEIMLDTQSGALSQVIINLINNALNHAFDNDKPGAIIITAEVEGNTLTIKLSDNGQGIDEDKQDKIFEKYFSTKMGKGGSGLGLFITEKLVREKLNGEIKYQDNTPQGASFIISLPLRK